MRPNMRSFLHTVQKNQMLMMAPNSLGRTAVIKSFIKHTTPLKVDPKVSYSPDFAKQQLCYAVVCSHCGARLQRWQAEGDKAQ